MEFTQKWIEESVKKFFSSENNAKNDLSQIQYVKIGEDYDGGFLLELSTQTPPIPFSDSCGGDEWDSCVLNHKQIEEYVKKNIENDFSLLPFRSPIAVLATSPISYPHERTILTKEDLKKAEEFERTIFKDEYFEKHADREEHTNWHLHTNQSFWRDIHLFTNVKVLRIQSGWMEDFHFLDELEKLEVLELVESQFNSTYGFEQLKRLRQLCCWMD